MPNLKRVAVTLISSTMCAVALADKYGVNESSSGDFPAWVLVVMFIGLLVYHLHDHAKLTGELASVRWNLDIERERTAEAVAKLQAEWASATSSLENERHKWHQWRRAHVKWMNGDMSDDDFVEALNRYKVSDT